MAGKKTALLHVIQASYGDALVLEYNTGTGATEYMLIDGGPGNIEPMFVEHETQARARFNLFHTLNRLSGSTAGAGAPPPPNAMEKIDTLVLTHDDVDHKQGIETLMASLVAGKKDPEHANDLYNVWIKGDTLMEAGKKPIESIWYNSLRNITTLRAGDKYKVKEKVKVTVGGKEKEVGKEVEKVVAPLDNWFDQQLEKYNAKAPPAISFNQDLAPNVTYKGRSATFAMRDANAKGGGLIEKGQFTIRFLGPLEKELTKSNKLLAALQGKNSLEASGWTFLQQELSKTTTPLAESKLEDFARVSRAEEKMALDPSAKNRSSIAFLAEDGPTRLLLLGDAIADIMKGPGSLYTPGGAPFDVTLMKVMHHGSGANNRWTRDPKRQQEEAKSDYLKEKKFNDVILSFIYFFSKIRAKKYVISGALDVHPNPHITTMAGIIAAAQERKEDIEIYLTNVLVPGVTEKIGEYFVGGTGGAISYVEVNLLAPGSHSGAVSVYGDDKDESGCWVSYIARNFWSSYPEKMLGENKGIAEMVKKAPKLRFEPYTKKLKKSPELPPKPFIPALSKALELPSEPYTGGLETSASDASTRGGVDVSLMVLPGGRETGDSDPGEAAESSAIEPEVLDVQPRMFTSMALSADAPVTTSMPFSTGTQAPIPAVPRASPTRYAVSAKLLGTSAPLLHEELVSHQPYSTRTLSGIDELLQYLVSENELTSQGATEIASNVITGNNLKFGAFAALFMGVQRSEELLAAIPFDFASSPDYLDQPNGPVEWLIQNLSAKVIDPTTADFRGSQGIYSLSFDMPARPSLLSWTLPFDSRAFPVPYKIVWDGSMSILVIWPHYAVGITSAEFRGQLETTTGKYNVVCRILLMSDQLTTYTVRFADDKFNTENYKMSLVDLAGVFGTDVQYGRAFKHLVLPVIERLLKDLDVKVGLDNPGFTLHKVLSKLILKDLFAELKLTDIPAWNPFSSSFSLAFTALRIVVEDAYSSADRKVLARLTGVAHTSGGTDLNLPIQFTAQYTPQEFLLYELALLPGIQDSLSIGHLLEVVDLSFDLANTFPGLSDLSNSLSISHVAVGWKSSLKPDYLKFNISLDEWSLVENVFEISQISVDIEAKNLRSENSKVFVLNGWGVVRIAQIDVEVFFAYDHASNPDIPDRIYFQVGTQQRAIPLGKILLHFLGENVSVLPDKLSSILEETVMDSFIVMAERIGGQWSVSKIQISMSIKGKIDAFSAIEIEEPNLIISIDNPFNKVSRGIYVGINAQVIVADVICHAQFTVASAEESIIAMTFDAGQETLTAEAVLTAFLPGADFVRLPPSLTFLAGIGIQRAALTLQVNQGKFSMSEITICASSTSNLQLWKELSLEQITLFVSYSKYNGKKVEFDAMLKLGKDLDYLTFTLAYEGPSSTPSGSLSDPGTVVSADTSSGAVWSAEAKYEGTLSVLDTLSRMSGLDLRKILDEVDLPALKKSLDIYITKLQVALTHSSDKSSFSFDADLEWLCFSHLRFACAKTSVWAYSFGFAIGSSKESLIDNIPILGPIIGAHVALEHISVVIYNYQLDADAIDPSLKIPETTSGGSISLAIACRLLFKGAMRSFTKVIGVSSMDIVGTVSSSMISLSAAIGRPITLFNGSMTLSGAVLIECKKENGMAPSLGIVGDALLDFGSHISKEPIKTRLWLLVNTLDAGLGFEFKLAKWHGVFGFDGLNFDDVVFAAIFPPEQFPVPSSFTIQGSVSLNINKASVKGSVNVHFVEENLMNSWASGSIEGLSLNNIIQIFAQVPPAPEYLDAGFGPLKFAIVPKDTVDESGKPLKQQFVMEGSFKLPFIHFEAAVKVDITPKKVTIDGHLSRIVVLHEKLFSILPSPEEQPPPPPGAGASLHVHINDGESPFYAKASGKLTFLALEKDLNFDVSKKGLEFLLAQDVWTNKGALSGSIDDTHLEVAASYEFSLDLIKPDFTIGGFHFKTNRIIGFGAAFSLNIVWKNIKWELKISGSFELFTLKIHKSFTIGADLMDLKAIGEQIAKWIVETLAQDFLNALKAILSSVREVIRVLKEAGLAMVEILKFLIHELGVAFEVAAQAIKEFFNVAWETIVNILHELGYIAQQIADGLKRIGVAAFEIATAIGKEFGEAVRDLCSTLLKEGGAMTSEIVNFFHNVFHDPGQAIVDLLVSWGRGAISIFGAVANVLAAPFKAVFGWIFGSRPKKTREQVQEELLLTLMVRMNELLDEPVDIQTEEDLEIIMQRCSVQRFQKYFNYAFNGAATSPPASQNPHAITATENKCSYTDGQISHIDEYRDRILSGLQLESWMKDAATADLNDELQLLTGLVPSAFWQVSPLKRTYYPPNSEQNPVELDGIIVFVNGALSIDGHDVTNTLSYYVGVYYEVPPPTRLARKLLQQVAFSCVPEANPPPVTDETSLTNALTAYATKEFRNELGFDYKQRPSDSLDPSLFYKTFNALSYFEDMNTKNVELYLTTKILSMAPLPEWVQGKALADMASEYRQIVSGGEKGNWRSFKVEHTYSRQGESFHPVNCKGIIVYYTATKTTDQTVTVSIAYVFFLGVYYETLNHAALVRKDLIKNLCDNLVKHMNNPESMPTAPDITRLTTLLDRYGRDQFYNQYKYELMGDATRPKKRVAGTPLCTVEQTGEFEDWNDQKIWNWVDTILSADRFSPIQNSSSIRKGMFDAVQYKLSSANDDGLNSWNVDDYDKTYSYDETANNARVVGMFIHTNGTLTSGNDTVKISFVHFSGVLYVEEDDPW